MRRKLQYINANLISIHIDPGKLQGIGEVKCMQYFNILLEKLSSCNILSWLVQDTLDLGAKG